MFGLVCFFWKLYSSCTTEHVTLRNMHNCNLNQQPVLVWLRLERVVVQICRRYTEMLYIASADPAKTTFLLEIHRASTVRFWNEQLHCKSCPSFYPRATALSLVRDASPFRGSWGLPYYGLLPIPFPAFPPYVLMTTHIRGVWTIIAHTYVAWENMYWGFVRIKQASDRRLKSSDIPFYGFCFRPAIENVQMNLNQWI
jgi:hypothetical protein